MTTPDFYEVLPKTEYITKWNVTDWTSSTEIKLVVNTGKVINNPSFIQNYLLFA